MDLVFTFTPDRTVSAGFPARVLGVVTAGGRRVCFVRLRVSPAEQERRIDRPDRHEFHKVTDVAFVRRAVREPAPEQPPADLEIDTERSSADETAATIVREFGLPPQVRQERYPALRRRSVTAPTPPAGTAG